MQKVSLVGARGYTGLETAKLLLTYERRRGGIRFERAYASGGFRLSAELLDSRAEDVRCGNEEELLGDNSDIVFLATPVEVSLRWAPIFAARGQRVIDLSGAFRLKRNSYEEWYGVKHSSPEWLAAAEYGLCPFVGPAKVSTRLIANPGCYATAISMALIPLLRAGIVSTDHLVIDAKSGTTGAGRKASETLLFSEVDEECLPYRTGKHQHWPEIQEAVFDHAGVEIDFHFATHLLPVKTGIVASIYAATITSKVHSIREIEDVYHEAFRNYPLVRSGRQISRLARLQNVRGTPFVHLSYEWIAGKLYLFSCIDNLMKGAASQAIENMNRLLDRAPGEGLIEIV
ncbi:MAG: N-acetyl-gamma-glutamyl-phosphate reductase [Bdellovibrio sp.]|nr:MAG: N-acetyl-gamma-glutamyl-phosphate reductase [Bdellovibrio sp.]